MNICFLHRLWPSYGGGETVTKCLANEFIRRGHQVHVLYFKSAINDGDSITCNPEIIGYCIPDVAFDEFSKEFFVNKIVAQRISKELIDYVRINMIDVVVNQWWPVEFHQDVREQTGVKIIKCLHMDPDTRKVFEFHGIKKLLFSFVEPMYREIETRKHIYSSDKYLRNVDLYLFLAPSFLKYYREHSKEPEKESKTDFIYNPLVYHDVINIDEWDRKEKRVLFVGRLVEGHKKVSRILRIWERYEKGVGGDWQLDIVGDGPDREIYENFVNGHDLRRVNFYGYQSPLPFYRQSSIFLITSAYEGFPMTLVESQQNGVIPIGMDSFASINDVLENKETGFIVPNGDEDAMYREMLALMDNPEERKRMALKGLETCKRYTVEKVVDKWESIFEKLGCNKD